MGETVDIIHVIPKEYFFLMLLGYLGHVLGVIDLERAKARQRKFDFVWREFLDIHANQFLLSFILSMACVGALYYDQSLDGVKAVLSGYCCQDIVIRFRKRIDLM